MTGKAFHITRPESAALILRVAESGAGKGEKATAPERAPRKRISQSPTRKACRLAPLHAASKANPGFRVCKEGWNHEA